ncbi:MAG: hypothetical protein KGL44_04840 [Sphingomonadales bacterium]|nr:hypothetical protein [Sphingomonadales bacterium]
MKRSAPLPVIALAAALWSQAAATRPVFVAETPGHTRFSIEDSSVRDLPSPQGMIRQVQLYTQSAPDPALIKGQVAAEGTMQFRCAAQTYREVTTTAIYKDGSRHLVIPQSETRAFSRTAPGRFERTLLEAACRMPAVRP